MINQVFYKSTFLQSFTNFFYKINHCVTACKLTIYIYIYNNIGVCKNVKKFLGFVANRT